MKEVWKDIDGYEGLYQVSNLGRIRSLYKRRKDVEFLKFTDCHGYKIVGLCKNKKQMSFRVHRIVASAFLPNPNNNPQVNHINGDKTDNRAVNLEWCTQSANMRHAYENGLEKANTVPAHEAKRVLTEEQVRAVRELLNKGVSTRAIAKQIGVGKTLISSINQGKAYGWVL